MRPAHLDDAPQPLGVRLARNAEQPLAAREEDGQAEQRLVDIVLVGGPQELSAFRTATAVASAKDDPVEQEMPSVDVPRDSRKSVSGEL